MLHQAPLQVLCSRRRLTAAAHQGPVDAAVQVDQVDSCAGDSTVDNTPLTAAQDSQQVPLVHPNLYRSHDALLKCLCLNTPDVHMISHLAHPQSQAMPHTINLFACHAASVADPQSYVAGP